MEQAKEYYHQNKRPLKKLFLLFIVFVFVLGVVFSFRKTKITVTGSSENVIAGIQKLKRLYHKAYEKFNEDPDFIELNYYAIDNEIFDEEESDKKRETDSKDYEPNLNLKKLKFKRKNLD